MACIFCDNPSELTLEHAIPQWLYHQFSPGTEGKFPVTALHFIEGKGYVTVRPHDSMSFVTKKLCRRCNNEWGSELEKDVIPILTPLTGKTFPQLVHLHFSTLLPHSEVLCRWLVKTAITTSWTLPNVWRPKRDFSKSVRADQLPHEIWMEVAKSNQRGIFAAITQLFPTWNGGAYSGFRMNVEVPTFQFCLQVNHLLLRVASTPGARAIYSGSHGRRPYRVYPKPHPIDPDIVEYEDGFDFLKSVALETFAECEGEVPPEGWVPRRIIT